MHETSRVLLLEPEVRLSPFTQQPDKTQALVQQLCAPCPLWEFPIQCRPGCSWTRIFVARACMTKLGPADQGLSSTSALTSTLATNPVISEFLRFMWATWKLLHQGQELQAKCSKVFVGRLHTTSYYKRSSSRTGLSQCWSTFLTTEDTLYIM